MSNPSPVVHYRHDYQAYPFEIKKLDLCFELKADHTVVKSHIQFCRSPLNGKAPLVLDGEDMVLQSIKLNERSLQHNEYILTPESLTIPHVPEVFTLSIETLIKPDDNTSLSGLYRSQSMYCTQCEAHGFRKITYYPDRPDVMTFFTTKIIANAKHYPVLLSNGNLLESAELPNGQHYAIWEDPFKKPCYLFALVAGQLAVKQDHFMTQDHRKILLEVYTHAQDIDKADYALIALKESMRWDEEKYDRIYDLDRYMIVATPDFNMGAMENKGLNIFNTKYVLAQPKIATDFDYQQIQAVIAHEYFHNWTGNRITCRDWFQLSLKEGLTVFRDQNFTADHHSADVKRIQDTKKMITAQFAEDASPMAHPIRPDSYIEMNNFYTVTVYEKGSEVIRMMRTIVGTHGFHKGMDLYFKRHDGQAVTCDDFVNCIAEGSGVDLTQFKIWYEQSGTPVVNITSSFDSEKKTYTLHFSQHTPATQEQSHKKELHIPITLGCIDQQGQAIALQSKNPNWHEGVFHLKHQEESLVFTHIQSQPIPSLLRDFSAPVHCKYPYTNSELSNLYANDPNPYNRWMAGQRLAFNLIQLGVKQTLNHQPVHFENPFIEGISTLMQDSSLELAFIAEALTLPSEKAIAEQNDTIHPDAIHASREYCLDQIAQTLRSTFHARYLELHDHKPYHIDRDSVQKRALKNTLLHYLARLDSPEMGQLCMQQLETANNMTDEFSALSALMVHPNTLLRDRALATFYEKWSTEALVVDKWLQLQALSYQSDTLAQVKALTLHDCFDHKNPNKVYALIGGLSANQFIFNQKNGAGYHFLSEQVALLDTINPQVASRMVRALMNWRRFDSERQKLMKHSLETLKTRNLSKDVYEIVSKSLLT